MITDVAGNSSRFIDAANLVTLVSLAAAILCAVMSINGLLAYAVVALMVSGLCDLFDGFVARRLSRDDEQRTFGGHLDSVVDACAFGFAPVILMYGAGLQTIWEIGLLILFAVCAVWRLAYFDTVGLATEGSDRFYTGLPTTYVAVFLPLAFIPGFFHTHWLRISVGIAAVVLGFAMVSSVPIRKPAGWGYVVFLVLALGTGTAFIVLADRLQ